MPQPQPEQGGILALWDLYTPQLMAMPDPDPLIKARDQTHVLMDTSRIRFHCTTMGTLREANFYSEVEIQELC